jgi:hypothetical protein
LKKRTKKKQARSSCGERDIRKQKKGMKGLKERRYTLATFPCSHVPMYQTQIILKLVIESRIHTAELEIQGYS